MCGSAEPGFPAGTVVKRENLTEHRRIGPRGAPERVGRCDSARACRRGGHWPGRLVLTLLLGGLWFSAAPPAHAADWPVFNHDPARSGAGAGDISITLANVRGLRLRWRAAFDFVADSTPILLSHVRSRAGGTRSLLFQTTTGGTTYAIDARTGTIVWRFRTHGPKITTSTPAADPAGQYIYAPAVDGQIHKLVAATGVEVRGDGFPLRITRMPDVEKDASALDIANGYLYAATSGYIGDQGPYDGHVVTVRLSDGVTHVFNTLCSTIHHLLLDKSYDPASRYWCSQVMSGIWSRAGVVVDPDPSMGGRIYVTTGNGLFDANRGGANYGDSVLSLRLDGSDLLGYFTPGNYDDLQAQDVDLGSTAPALLPRESGSRTPFMAVQGGKDGIIRLLNRARLGGVRGELQDVALQGAALFTAPAVWKQPGAATWVYIGDGSAVTALRLETDAHGVSRLKIAWSAPVAGTSPVVIDGVVFAATGGAINALDGRTGKLMWSSTWPSSGGSIGDIHWQSPIAVDGWVYCSDQTGRLSAYVLSGA